jgi:hypothetical protein
MGIVLLDALGRNTRMLCHRPVVWLTARYVPKYLSSVSLMCDDPPTVGHMVLPNQPLVRKGRLVCNEMMAHRGVLTHPIKFFRVQITRI